MIWKIQSLVSRLHDEKIHIMRGFMILFHKNTSYYLFDVYAPTVKYTTVYQSFKWQVI